MSASKDTEPKEVVTLTGLPPVLDNKQVSRILRMNRNTVYDAGKRGEIPGYFRVRNCVRYFRDVFIPWVKGGGRLPTTSSQP
jgi:hypothetical protein